MRTLLSFLTALIFTGVAQGAVTTEYWIDDGIDSRTTEEATEFTIDFSQLSRGLHTLNYRALDEKGNYSALHTHIFFAAALDTGKASKVTTVEYWFDNGIANRATADSTQFVIDLKTLPRGLHTLNYRVRDDKNMYSSLHTHMFYAGALDTERATSITAFEYWWDDDPATLTTSAFNDSTTVVDIDCSSLPAGLHSISYHVRDNKGYSSPASRHFFFKPEATATVITSYTYWWNDCTDKAVTVELEQPAAEFVLSDELTLPEYARTDYAGHYTATLNFVFTDDRGRQTTTHSTNVSYPDNDAPVTEIDADDYAPSAQVKLTWSEKAGGKDVASYNVYVSDNGGIFLLWKADTTATSAIFKGESGHRYRFTVTAVDNDGNRETYDENKCISVTFK